MQSRVMYLEAKGENFLWGAARIARVTFSQTGRTVYYRGRAFRVTPGCYKTSHVAVDTGEPYWISGCKRDGTDRLYSGVVEIDDDVRAEYWTVIRGQPARAGERRFRSPGKYRR